MSTDSGKHRPGAAFVAGLLLIACIGCGERPAPPIESSEYPFANLDPSVAYVGIDACRSCHLGVVSTYAHTGMRLSFYSLAAAAERWDASVRPPLEVDDRSEAWVLGSGYHARTLFLEEDEGELRREAICWYAERPRWEPCPADATGNEHLGDGEGDACLFCHNAAIDPDDPTGELPQGIDCERCHGPGGLHVERWKGSADTGSGEPDRTIVNPRRLPLDQRMAVCMQCHLGDAAETARVPRRGREPESFRPGRPLSDLVVPFRFAESNANAFGTASQGDRLMLSRCYTESDGRLDCLTCHNPHVSAYHEERPEDLFRKQCLRCHQTDACAAPPETRRQTAPPDDCIACHMRRAEPHDLRPALFTDHWIRRRIEEGKDVVRESLEIEPVLPAELENLSEEERAHHTHEARRMLDALRKPSD
jgi:hypothetical protein